MSLNRTAVDVPSSTDVSVERINDMLDRLDITKEEDEEVEFVTSRSPSVEMSDLGDPAILQVGITASCSVKFKYTKDHLIKLKESPFSLKRPEYLDSAYDNNNGIWDPERWHFDRKTSDPSAENGSRGNDMDNNHRRRSGDPRDRIRKEHDGIVLSPQRRSFNSGCYVPVREPARSNRSHSPIGKGEASHIGHREISQGPSSRRIGSGRIFFDYPEKTEADNDFGYRRERRDTDRERDERYERRSFSRESEPNRPNKSKEGGFTRNGARYDRRRISNESREEEPEWFSEGPMSQHDTIELRGFDDAERSGVAPSSSSNKKKMTAAQKKKAKERGAKNVENSAQNSSKEDVGKQEGPGARSTPTLLEAGSADLMSQSPIGGDKGAAGDTSEASNVRNSAILEDQLFTIEDMLKSDNINMLLPNGVGLESGDTSGSKFSRWFSREKSPPPTAANQKQSDGSRRSSLHDDHHHLIKNILNDISEPTVSIPCDSNSYFAPISPAASTGSVSANPGHPQAAAQPINFMEILQRSGKHQGGPLHADLPPTMKNMEVPGKLLCVEELETRIRQGDKGNPGEASTNIRMSASKHNKTKEDNSAFQKLLAQMQDGHVIPASNGPIPQQKTTQPMSIMEMLSHSQKQEEAARLAQMMNSSVSQGHLSNDLNYKLQQSQVQQRQIEVFSKLLASGVRQQQARTPPPLNDIGLAGRELLNRPEAQAILQGLKRGDITPQHLYQQLANPAMQSRHRELLQMILKLQSPSVAAGSRVLSPVPPHPMFQQQQQLRVSPLPPNAMHQRIPSPRELQVHTQNIMQRALIKKKLEEQQENFRKKQELQQTGQSPGGISPAKNVGSPTQLAFTPTAVLRKMTAEKDEGSKDAANKNNDTQTKSHQQGRAVTGMRNQGQPSQQQAGSQTQQTVQQQVENQGQIKQVQQQTQWNTQFQQMNKQPGRPIVKNNANFQQPQQSQQQAQYDQFLFQQRLMNQQQRKQNQQFGGLQGQYGGFANNPQQYSQLPHQLRAQHQQQQQPHVRPQQQQQQQQAGLNQQWQQIIQHNQSFDNRQIGRGGGNDGDMSPTSNQLARWFSPDLLERARKGKLPNMPASGRAQHALSLEEIERQTAPVIHN